MTIGEGIAYASFWLGLFGTICWFRWLVHLGGMMRGEE